MNPTPRFLAYAAAFEKSYGDDDWTRLGEFFTEGAVYAVTGGPPLGGRFEGREAVLAQFGRVTRDLDKRFDDRKVEIVGAPRVTEAEDGATIEFEWRATYAFAGAPDLTIGGTERAVFGAGEEGDRIVLLEDLMNEGDDLRAQEWMTRYFDDAPPSSSGAPNVSV